MQFCLFCIPSVNQTWQFLSTPIVVTLQSYLWHLYNCITPCQSSLNTSENNLPRMQIWLCHFMFTLRIKRGAWVSIVWLPPTTTSAPFLVTPTFHIFPTIDQAIFFVTSKSVFLFPPIPFCLTISYPSSTSGPFLVRCTFSRSDYFIRVPFPQHCTHCILWYCLFNCLWIQDTYLSSLSLQLYHVA